MQIHRRIIEVLVYRYGYLIDFEIGFDKSFNYTHFVYVPEHFLQARAFFAKPPH